MRLYPLMIAVACVATPLLAGPGEVDRRSMTVPLAGVRFDDPQSVANLRRRIERAVRQVCAPDDRSLFQQMRSRTCRIGAQRATERQLARYVDDNRLASLYP